MTSHPGPDTTGRTNSEGITTNMRLRRKLIAAALAGSAVVAGFSMPAQAATGATFTIQAGLLTISEPASTVNLGSIASGNLSFQGNLGTVSVSDQRANLAAAWTTTVSSTNFTTGTATAAETVANSNIAYASGARTNSTSHIGAFTPGTVASLALPGTAGAWAGTGVNVVEWNPLLTFTLQVEQVAGTYSGTITHSVA